MCRILVNIIITVRLVLEFDDETVRERYLPAVIPCIRPKGGRKRWVAKTYFDGLSAILLPASQALDIRLLGARTDTLCRERTQSITCLVDVNLQPGMQETMAYCIHIRLGDAGFRLSVWYVS